MGTVVVGSCNSVAPAGWPGVDFAEGQVTAVEGCEAVGLVLGRTEDRPDVEVISNYGFGFIAVRRLAGNWDHWDNWDHGPASGVSIAAWRWHWPEDLKT